MRRRARCRACGRSTTIANPLPVAEPSEFFGVGGRSQQSWQPFAEPDVRFYGEIVALVVADTSSPRARRPSCLRFDYEAQGSRRRVRRGRRRSAEELPDRALSAGDIEAAMQDAAEMLDADYDTSANTHNAMELFATTAQWAGEELTVHVPSQWVEGFRAGIAKRARHPAATASASCRPSSAAASAARARLFTWTSLVALAARALERPVKLYVTREQGFTTASFRAETRQHVPAGGAGRTAASPGSSTRGRELSSRADTYVVNGAEATARMYHADAVRTGVTCVHADRQTPGFMRAPAGDALFLRAGIRRRRDGAQAGRWTRWSCAASTTSTPNR